jgi:hypothetical protein
MTMPWREFVYITAMRPPATTYTAVTRPRTRTAQEKGMPRAFSRNRAPPMRMAEV